MTQTIAFYVGKLGFELLEDTPRSATKRWVPDSRCAPSGMTRGA